MQAGKVCSKLALGMSHPRATFAFALVLAPSLACSVLLSVDDYDDRAPSDAAISNDHADHAADVASGDASDDAEANVPPPTPSLPAACSDALPVSRLTKPSGDAIYSLSPTEVANAVNLYGYTNEGAVFSGYASGNGGHPPVYRLQKNNIHFYTANAAERADALAMGYSEDGVGFCGAALAVCGVPVIRLHKGPAYMLTTSSQEISSRVDAGWVN